MTLAPSAGPYCLRSGDGIVEMRFSTMATRSDLRVDDVQELFRNQGIFRESLFYSPGFSPVLR